MNEFDCSRLALPQNANFGCRELSKLAMHESRGQADDPENNIHDNAYFDLNRWIGQDSIENAAASSPMVVHDMSVNA